MQAQVYQIKVYEDGSARLMARVVGLNNVKITQADVAAITWSYWAEAAPATELDAGELTVADVVFDALQTESWTKDPTGYNVRWDAPPATFPNPGTFRLSITFTMQDESVLKLQVSATVIRTAAG